MFRFIVWVSFLFFGPSFIMAQLIEKKIKLPKELNEISGLEILGDSLLIAVNDGGNAPIIYFINLKGKITKKTIVSNALNKDWEDLAMDEKGNLYISDAGNNLNQRQDLCVLKVDVNHAFFADSICVEKIYFNYAEQKDFKPDEYHRIYDCEAIFWKNDSLHLLTKNTSKPLKNEWSNGSDEYVLPLAIGEFKLKSTNHFWTGGDNKLKNQVTAADFHDHTLFILTYGYLVTYMEINGTMVYQGSKKFKRFTQKEAIVRTGENELYVAAEKNWLLGGPYLYKIKTE